VAFHRITYLNIRDYNKADEEGRDVVEMYISHCTSGVFHV
jgi:hypothetical protein